MTMPKPDPDFEDPGPLSEAPARWWEAPLYGLLILGPVVAFIVHRAVA